MYRNALNIIILIILFIGNIFFDNHKYYFLLIYSSLLLYNIHIIYSIIKFRLMNYKEILCFLFASLLTYLFSYFIICDPNPINCIITYYIFFPNLLKAILIIIFHTYFLFKYSIIQNYNYINQFNNNYPVKKVKTNYLYNREGYYFLSNIIKYLKKNRNSLIIFLIVLILFFSFNIILFVNRIKIWVYFNNKEKTLPTSTSKNTTFYLTASIVNMEGIIVNFIDEMKKLISIMEVLIILKKKNIYIIIIF